MTPEPDEDFVDPADEYRMPWEEDRPVKVIVLRRFVRTRDSWVQGVRHGRVGARVGIPGHLLNGVEYGTRRSTSVRCTY